MGGHLGHLVGVIVLLVLAFGFQGATSGFHLNLKSANPRPSRPNNSVAFGAADGSTAEAVAAEFANWTGDQQTSLYENVFSAIKGYGTGAYPVGTRLTLNVLVQDSSGGVWRMRVRNVNAGVSDASWANLFLGNADVAEGFNALGAAPVLPNSGSPVAVVVSSPAIIKG